MTTDKTFADLGVRAPLTRRARRARHHTARSRFRLETLPDTLAGRDVLGRGKTGSGKTLAFSIPLVSRLGGPSGARRGRRVWCWHPPVSWPPRSPRRSSRWRPPTTCGSPRSSAASRKTGRWPRCRSGVDIVVACPGRLEDLMKQRLISLDAVEITVIDEADHMADLGFLPGVTRILAATPAGGQRLLFSATLDNGVDKLVKRFLRNQVMHSVDEAQLARARDDPPRVPRRRRRRPRRNWCTGSPPAPVAESCSCAPNIRPASSPSSSPSPACRQLTCTATFLSPRATATLRRSPRARRGCWWPPTSPRAACTSTRSNSSCTSIRPTEHKAYLHRSGRTARAGNAGDVVTVVLPEQRKDTQALMRKAGIRVTPQEVAADSAAVHALVGEIAPYRAPAPKADPPRPSQPRRSGPSGQQASSAVPPPATGAATAGR